MNKLLKPDNITNGLLTTLIEDIWKVENEKKVRNLTREELIKIHKALIDYNNTLRFENGDLYPFFDNVVEDIYHPISYSSQDRLNIKNFYNKAVIIYDSINRHTFRNIDDIYNGEGIRVLWFENGDIKVFYSTLHINSEGFSFINSEITGSNLYENYDLNIWNYIEDNGRKIHFSESLGDSYIYIYLLANIKQNYEKIQPLDYFLKPEDIDTISCFSTNVRIDLWNSIINLAEDIIDNDKDDRKLDLLEFLFEFMFLIGIESYSSHTYKLLSIINKKSAGKDESANAIIAMLDKIYSNVESIGTNINDVKADVRSIDLKLDMLNNRFNGITIEIKALLEENADEMGILVSHKSDELVGIINELYTNNMEQEYIIKQKEVKELYPELRIKGEALFALSSGFILAGQSNYRSIDQSGAILLLAKGLEILLNDNFKEFLIDKITANQNFVSRINEINCQGKDKTTIQWLIGRDKATLGQVAFFCSKFNNNRYNIGQEVNNCLGIFGDIPRSKEAIIREIINYIKLELTTVDVNNLRNGFIHEDIAQLEELNKVTTKIISLLTGLNSIIKSNS